MSFNTDLKLAYHMGYDDALAKRKPDASKAQVLVHYDLAIENAKLRELFSRYMDDCLADRFGQPDCFVCQELQELGIEVGE